jgi:DNA-binding beta-propeller fold protein YncE
MKRILFLVSVAVMSGVVWLAGSGAQPDKKADYQVVANWPQLPDNFQFGQVTGVAVDANDRVFIFHRGKQPIMVFDRAGKFLRSWGEGLFKTAHGLRIDAGGNIWTTDLGTHLVMKFDAKGKLLLTLGTKGQPGDSKDKFNKPADVAVTPTGDFYVADGYGNSRVVKFAKDGTYLKEWGKKGKGEGEFNLPHSICLDAQGRVFVGDRENNRVQVFDADGKFLTQWATTGAPYGLTLHPSGMFLADGRANNVKLLNLDGKTLHSWGTKGAAPGQFDLPHWVGLDSQGAMYVAEVNGKRVQKFAPQKGG